DSDALDTVLVCFRLCPYFPPSLDIPYIVLSCFFFLFSQTAPTSIYTLSLHDALPIYFPGVRETAAAQTLVVNGSETVAGLEFMIDRKSTRLNSSHGSISYAVFCLKKKR